MVGADVGGEHGVVFLADLEDPLPCLDVPGDRDSRLTATAAAGQQQVAVAAELEDMDRALGEGQHADQVAVGRPVKKHLLVPADRDQRCPRARRPWRRRRWAWPGDERLGRRFSGMAGVPAGLPSAAGSSLNSNFGLALAVSTLPEFSSAPPSIHLRMSSISASGILGELGGILGSSLCDDTRRSVLLSGSPGSITLPEPPPCMAAP